MIEFQTNSLIDLFKAKTNGLKEMQKCLGINISDIVFLETYRGLEGIINLIISELCCLPEFSQKFLQHVINEGDHLAPRHHKKLLKEIFQKFFNGKEIIVNQKQLLREITSILELNLQRKIKICTEVFGFKRISDKDYKGLIKTSQTRNILMHNPEYLAGKILMDNDSLSEFIDFTHRLVCDFEKEFNNCRNQFEQQYFFNYLDLIVLSELRNETMVHLFSTLNMRLFVS